MWCTDSLVLSKWTFLDTDEQVGEELNGDGGELIGLGAQRAGHRRHTYRYIDRHKDGDTKGGRWNWGTGSNLWHPKVGLSANCSPEFAVFCWAKLNRGLQLSQQNNATEVSSHFCLILPVRKRLPPLNPVISDFYLVYFGRPHTFYRGWNFLLKIYELSAEKCMNMWGKR